MILLAFAVVISFGALWPYLYPQVRFSLPMAKLQPIEEEEVKETAVASPSMSDYLVVSEQNLFHPDRKIPPEKKEAQQLPKPELILYATLISEGMSVAYVEDKKNPKTTPGRGRRQTVMKKGDAVSGFVLKEIENDRIILARGDETMVVHLSQGDKPRMSETPGAPGAGPKPVAPTPVTRPGVPSPTRPSGSVPPSPAPVAGSPPAVKTEQQRVFAPPLQRGIRLNPPKSSNQVQQPPSSPEK